MENLNKKYFTEEDKQYFNNESAFLPIDTDAITQKIGIEGLGLYITLRGYTQRVNALDDRKGKLYLYFNLEEIAKMANCNTKKTFKIMELLKQINLLEYDKLDKTEINMIYVLKTEYERKNNGKFRWTSDEVREYNEKFLK